jgi:acyl transferase domain-containing protein/NADPH:quinone reductase-like Zn-dependent oxidoreductase/acyl carrier protein
MHEDPIAIVGAACRLPGAESLARFWDVLASGRDAVTEIPDDRWSKDLFYHPKIGEPGASYTWAAGVLGPVDRFDAEFFGISPREAEQVDPQQRLLLELAWEAFEDAGIPAAKVAGGDCGVFVGASSVDYGDIRTGDPASGNAYFMTGVTASILANRISYLFDLHGPSFTVDTACSSSLVALDLACRDIRSGRIPMALVGGVNLLLAPYPFIGFCRATMLSPTGRCYAFDARANGYVRAEGGGVAVLKPLGQALRDGDRVRAVILGTGVNSDGRTTGLSLPSRDAQSRLLTSVYEASSVSPDMLAFIEAHGTGTPAGDPIELGAIGDALGSRRSSPLPVGSVKTNVGHLEPASGMAGLLKAMLSLEHRLIPPSLHFESPNPNIPFGDLNLAVVTRPIALAADGRQLVAGVNSFGFGGTNAHAILASAPARPASAPARNRGIGSGDRGLAPLLLSARSQAALKSLADAWADLLPDLDDETAGQLIRGAARRRHHHNHRLVARGQSTLDLADRLQSFAASPSSPRVKAGEAASSGKVAFIYSGNGVQRPGMAQGALAGSAVFRQAVAELDLLLSPLLGWSVLERLGADDHPLAMTRTDVAQPLLFAVQVGITAALRESGIDACYHAGHSVGEIAAAWASGALSLADACKVIAIRSRQQQRSAGLGGMAALGIGEAAARGALRNPSGGLELAAINSRRAVTVAGPRDALAQLEAGAAAEGWRYTKLDIDYPFHSAALDFIRDDLVDALGGLAPQPAGDRFVSTVEGVPIPETRLDAVYWWRNIRDPVRFADAIDSMIGDGARVFIEIGPHPALLSYIREGLKNADVAGRAVATLTQSTLAGDPFPGIAAECHIAGADMSTASIFDGPAETDGLPSYPWQREPYWFPLTREGANLERPVRDHPLLGYRRDSAEWDWTNRLGIELQPWLGDHRLEGVPVVPGAALLEIAAAAARVRFPGASGLEVSGLEIPRALVLEAGTTRTLTVRLEEDGGVRIESKLRFSDEAPTLHAVARIAASAGGLPNLPPAPPAAFRRIDAPELYRAAEQLGLNYGPAFRTVRSVSIIGDGEALVTFDPTHESGADFLVAPTFFDGALQGCLALFADRGGAHPGESFIPSRMGRVRIFPPYGRRPATARIAIRRPGLRSVSATIAIFDESGAWIASAEDCWFQRIRLSRQNRTNGMLFRTDYVATCSDGNRASPLRDIAAMLDDVVLRIGSEHSLDDARLLLGAYVAARCDEAVKSVCPSGRSIRTEDLVAAGAINHRAAPLLDWMLRLMEAHGAAVWGEDGWRLADDSALPEPDLVWRTILEDQPEFDAELAIMASTDFAGLLRSGDGETTPPSMVEHMLYASPSGRIGLAALCETILEMAKAWPVGRPLRLLEIGAGAGILARRLLPDLTRQVGTLVYVASDTDGHALPRLTQSLARFDGARALRWDPRDAESPPPDGQFDLVVSLYDFSRKGLGHDALVRIHESLAPRGVALTIEPEPNLVWDCAFGREAAWWRSAHHDVAPSRIAGGDRLSSLLRRAGFHDSWSKTIECGLWPLALVAAQRSADEIRRAAAGGGAVMIVGAEDILSRRLSDRLAESGCSARRADPAGEDEAFGYSDPGAAGPPMIVLMPTADGRGDEPAAASAARRLAHVLDVVRRVRDSEQAATLWIVTHDAHALLDGAVAPSPSEAALWGLGRTLMNELPRVECRLVDLPAAWTADDKARVLAAEIAAPDQEREIVWSESGRFVPRLRRGLEVPEVRGDAVTLDVVQPGLLDTLCWRQADRRAPGPGEILIATRAAGLNFRDVMWAMALLPEEALQDGFAGPTLGLECAGIIEAVGPGVDDFAVGDRVMAMAPAGLSSHVITAAHAALAIPDGMSFAAAATLPVTSLTVLYSLDHLARLQADEWVLIHGAAGGVGLMAIQYALHKGATVIATAGSEAKRAFLGHLGVDHVLDSRSLAFADEVRAITDGRGVDVVLNSLSGEAMERSLALLKPFGRFIELGKRDFMMDTRVGLRALRQNIAYHAVDIDRLPLARPELAAQLLRQAIELVEEGALHPLPHRVYPFADVAEAFRLMQGAGHIGKIVLEPDGLLVPAAAKPMSVRGDRTYLVTGGLSGFGLATAQWLADRGARHLALLGRRGLDTDRAPEALADFRLRSIDARAFACDVADAASLALCLAEIRSGMPPLAGVFHAAAVIDDGLAADLTQERIETVLKPKLDGAANLDRLTRADEIELFVLFSSATTILGAPGQGNYVAANMALEAVARGRAVAGLPAVAVAFGPIADVGMLAERADAREALIRRLSTAPMPAREALDMLPRILSSGRPVVALAPFRWAEVDQVLPILKSPMFAEIGAEARSGDNTDLRARLEQLDPDETKEILVGILTEEAARILAFSPDRIDPSRPLTEFGMDSLMAVELRLAIETRLGIDLPLVSLSDEGSLSSLATRIARNLSKRDDREAVDDIMAPYETMKPDLLAPRPAAEIRAEAAE